MLTDYQKSWLWDHFKFFLILFGGFLLSDGANYLWALYNGVSISPEFLQQIAQVIITAIFRAVLVEAFPGVFPGPRPPQLPLPPAPPQG